MKINVVDIVEIENYIEEEFAGKGIYNSIKSIISDFKTEYNLDIPILNKKQTKIESFKFQNYLDGIYNNKERNSIAILRTAIKDIQSKVEHEVE